ncbi:MULTISPECIES: ABC transporter substrate-binding protein [Clostridium]|jgi:amino acid/amide ABC transporter substrate-binding protein, HAAT family (TC 3.A.1.4.-)|uniref:ABC transporter substrate-binding protein n=2 Tax=Clostridium beijerinckii TaxID=1520 RepID=A0A1S8RE86_CLOBE|nr:MULTISPECIES: ABC transporter substrate-binding protein [Clostridium]ABR33939.1 Extracellular ligand-binding receptor [Clostridium beijerinckii NCIMB 8052]AIU02212.1 extracellular ligand-binding receptor [Clostridium beijerinckii ATCC 35702]ALB47035.1 ABC transporter substrate-binding protein [Clostridium beijerinckii NRRL B-598]AVK50736.1 branched-chain amino acid ABC transporter substrate-binding protein [Clostridium sp. MF28]MBC2456369.1 ABC transporter substrate-binding protein [Clostri
MKRKISLLLVIAMMTSFTLGGCNSKSGTKANEDSDVIKIGVFEPMTGANAAGGQLETEGAKLANKIYPTVLGKKVELVFADNKSDKVEAASAAANLIEQEHVNAIIGSYGSGFSMAAGDIVQEAKVPAVGVTCTNPLVTAGNDYYFRVCFIDPFQGTVMAKYAANKLKAKKVAILQEVSSDYSVGICKFFTDEFKKLTEDNNAVVAKANYNTGDQDFSAQLTNIKGSNPDVIFAPGNFTEGAMIIKQARQLGITAPIIGADTWETPEFLDIGKEDVEGTVFSTFFATETPITEESKIFLDEYRKQYNKEPAAATALGYDAYLVILDAIKRANSADPVKIRDEIAKTKDFPGAAGVITIDENNNAVKEAVLKIVKDGKFTYLDTIKPE